MSQNTVSLIKDLSDPNSSNDSIIYRDIYCYCLFMNVNSYGPVRLFVTDFTSNPMIANRHVKSHVIEGYEIPIEQIFQVELFKERWAPFYTAYEETYGEPLIDTNLKPPFRLSKKLILMKINVQLKTYNNILEGKLRSLKFLDKSDHNIPNVRMLFSALTKLPRTFFIEHIDKVRVIFPPEYIAKVLKGYSHTQVALSDPLALGYRESSNGTDPEIKQEDGDTDIPDTLFPSDYVNSSEPEDDKSNGLEEVEAKSFDRNTVEWLKNHVKYIDNRIYTVKARIVDHSPSDWSHICSKSYIKDGSMRYPSCSDPEASTLELVIADPETCNEGNINGDNSLEVYISNEDVFDLIKFRSKEVAYVNCAKLNNMVINKNVVTLSLYLKSFQLECGNKITLWSAKNLKLSDILD